MTSWQILEGDCRDVLRSLPAQSVHTVVTSPPYFGLRDYGTGEWDGGDPTCDHKQSVARHDGGRAGVDGFNGSRAIDSDKGAMSFRDVCGKCGARRVDRQIGLEPTPDEFVAAMVAVFREVRRVLRDDGTLWLNLGDSYAREPAKGGTGTPNGRNVPEMGYTGAKPVPEGMKQKDLIGIPWMVAFALRADGWYMRSDIIWHKTAPMPESVRDRPTSAHEHIFLLAKRPTYYYDSDAIREQDSGRPSGNGFVREHRLTYDGRGQEDEWTPGGGRNKRNVWTVNPSPFAGAHFATFPPKLIEPCILAGAPERACGECGAPWVRVVEREATTSDGRKRPSPAGAKHDGVPLAHRSDGHERLVGALAYETRTIGFEPSCSHGDGSASGVVLDPFAGSGTTGMVALRHNRSFVGIELNSGYAAMARERIETAVRLGFRAPQAGPEQIPGQLDIFAAREPVVVDEESLYRCEDCGITQPLRDLTSGCPSCGETMVPEVAA